MLSPIRFAVSRGIAFVALSIVLALPAAAICNAPFLISSLDVSTGDYSYVYTPGVIPGGGDGFLDSSVTDAFSGFFWHVGNGDPAIGFGQDGFGNDNGAFAARDWLYAYPSFPAIILTSWAADTGIDGCIDNPQGGPAERCLAIQLNDLTPGGTSVFAVLAVSADATTSDFVFTRPGNAPIVLAPIPVPTLDSSDLHAAPPTFVVRTPSAGTFSVGTHVDTGAACVATRNEPLPVLIEGARFRAAVVPRGQAAPALNDLSAWPAVTLASGPDVRDIGTAAAGSIPCTGVEDVYFSYTLLHESGFEPQFTSNPIGPFSCGPCGNGILDDDEECDDANASNADGCQATCLLPVCGDGVVDPGQGEDCDDGGNVNGDGCDATCLAEPCMDGDGDGYGSPGSVDCPRGDQPDCDDTDAEVSPDADEALCDGIDNDCDAVTPDDVNQDRDPVSFCAGDCDDLDRFNYPGNFEVCDRQDNDCDGLIPQDEIDNDGDGFTACEGDCDDTAATAFPGGDEVLCDGLDNDCDPATGDDKNQDGDPVSFCEGDCADFLPFVFPGSLEFCDGFDNDCVNGADFPGEADDQDNDDVIACIDCDDTRPNIGDCAVCGDGVVQGPEDCEEGGVDTADCDADCTFPRCGDGIVNSAAGEECDDRNIIDDDGCTAECLEQVCGDGVIDVDRGEECDDGNLVDGDGCQSTCLLPACGDGVVDVDLGEQCDDGNTDNGDGCDATCANEPCMDDDGDGFGSPGSADCPQGDRADCDDTNAAINPAAAEALCDEIDNDCDPATNDDVNQDGDPVTFCEGDCDDSDPGSYPGNAEQCDGIDNDCDGDVIGDETDDDGDGFAECELDCDDTDATIFPGAPEVLCDGIDNDCFPGSPDDVNLDGDPVSVCAGDCDDADPNNYPGNDEVCDDRDNDCDGEVSGDETDDDGDTFSECGGDCDDTDPLVRPGGTEIVCDGKDNDCDPATPDDDDCGFCGDGIVNPSSGEQCDGGGVSTDDCDFDCTFVVCGDGVINAAAGEDCEGDSPDADFSCTDDCRLVCVAFVEDMETGAVGWTHSTRNVTSHVGDPPGPETWHLDAATCRGQAFASTMYVSNGNDGPSCTPDSSRDLSQLLSPVIQLSPAATLVRVQFDALSYDEAGACTTSALFDKHDVGITVDGGLTYKILNDCTSLADGSGNVVSHEFDVSEFAGQQIQIIFVYDTVDETSGHTFAIDNVVLLASECECGNGVIDDGEDCDDVGESLTCDADCSLAACGDGVTNATAGEQCDDGNLVDGDGCDANCAAEPCMDADGDGYGSPGSVDCPAGGAEDCDDGNPDVFPGATEVLCDGLDNDCDGATTDDVNRDGDPVSFCDGDCDDFDPDNYPGNTEVCDGRDNDCDGTVSAEEADIDGDGVSECDGDCDDSDATAFPGADETLCDSVDNDCDPATADDVNADGDAVSFCEGDCNDADASIFPGAPELCDRADTDCDGDVPADELDLDLDTFTTCEGDCDDNEATAFPGNTESLCDGIDNDCDPATVDDMNDDGDPVTFCEGDCDDLAPNNYPGNDEQCDGLDNDCVNAADFPGETTDNDGDGARTCLDCDDDDPNVTPFMSENCSNGIDDNCDGRIDGNDPQCAPFLVELDYFKATATPRGVLIEWATLTEIDTLGFRILRTRTRADEKAGRSRRPEPISDLIPALGSALEGREYAFTDTDRQGDGVVLYYLEDVDTTGRRTLHGPVQVKLGRRTSGARR